MTRQITKKSQMPGEALSPPAHFYIYENLNLVADSRIEKEHISIGSSQKADVVLNHSAVADIHAFIHFEGAQAFLTNRYPENGMHLNGQSVHLAKLNNEDVIDVGPYAVKVKMGGMDGSEKASGQDRYCVALVNRYKHDLDLLDAADRLAKMFRTDRVKMARVIAKSEHVIKRDLSKVEAERYQIALQKAGIFCALRQMVPDPDLSDLISSVATKNEAIHQQHRPSINKKAASLAISGTDTKGVIYEDTDDDDEEALWRAPFALTDKLAKTKTRPTTAMKRPSRLQIVKTNGNQVIDVQFLDKGQKYVVPTAKGKHCLARKKGENTDYIYFPHTFSGYVKNGRGETAADIDSYKTTDYLFRKRRRLYRIDVPQSGEVVVSDGHNQYTIFKSHASPSPAVSVFKRPSAFSWKHWALSAATHLVLVLCLSIYWYFQVSAQKAPGPHFVKIDPAIMQQLQPKKMPKPPKKEPPPKPVPQKVVEKVEPLKKTAKKKPPVKQAKPIKSKKSMKRVAKATQPSRHPKAGGGFGEGNIRNRNINQAGLLSVLGTAPAVGQSATVASVTNLDAVAVPGATDSQFTVGGVKGSLGNGKIAVAGGQMLETKGSKQVFRSAGASGPGHVAALEKGTTGKKQVQAMVTAKMSRTVKIQGGMSREMVKRVIDQHLQEITYCYETALMSNPAIMGRIVFEWKILMSGRVGQVRIVASSVNSHEVHNCIKSAIQSWQFPKPSGAEVVVSYPFVFDLVAF